MQSPFPIDSRYLAQEIFELIRAKTDEVNLSQDEKERQKQIASIIDEHFLEIKNISMDNEILNNLQIDDLPIRPFASNATSDISQLLTYKAAASYLSEFNCIDAKELKKMIFITTLLRDIKDKEKNILHVAIERKDLPMIKLVIALAPELLSSRVKGKTPLHLAVESEVCVDTIDWLTKKSTLLFPSDLSSACQVDVNAQDNEGNTALHYALKFNNRELAFKLRDDLKSNLDVENHLGLTSAETAISTLYDLVHYSNAIIRSSPSNDSLEKQAMIKAQNGPFSMWIQELVLLAKEFSPSKGLDNCLHLNNF